MEKKDIIERIEGIMSDVGCTPLSSKAGRYLSIWIDNGDGKCYVKTLAGLVKDLNGLSEKDLEKILKDLLKDFS